jgi:hypothetical protein
MKKMTEVKYPNSANLFQFCRRVLDHKFGGIRVIDQDVGQILGFDPADCSHWKKGKKNIRSIQAMKSIANHLGVDEKLIVDVAAGELDETEAFYEYSGYGAFSIDNKIFEAAKKDFYRRNAASWTKDKENEFCEFFDASEAAIDRLVNEIHERINFKEAPLYLPEVVAAYSSISLSPVDSLPAADAAPLNVTQKEQTTSITYVGGTEMRPYMRYRIAKAMAPHFLSQLSDPLNAAASTKPNEELSEYAQHLLEVQSNLFAAKLLTPATLLRREMGQVNVAKDIVSQLAEIFWVSKTFMNRRLKDILQIQASA